MRAFVIRWEMTFYAVTIVTYLAAVVCLVFLFPQVSNLWTSVFVLVGSLTASIGAAISAIKTREPE